MSSKQRRRLVSTKYKSIRRKLEAIVGIHIADMIGKIELKKSKLVGPKQIFLPKCNISMNYYEREAMVQSQKQAEKEQSQSSTKTILLCHGIGSDATEFCSFLKMLNLPSNVRIIIPDLIGHGQDLKRVSEVGVTNFEQPNARTIMVTMSEFLDVTNVDNCNAFGISFGGAVVYYLRLLRPDIIKKTILVAPALLNCLADPFLHGLLDGTERFLDVRSRKDIIHLFRNLLWTDPKKRNNDQDNGDNNNDNNKLEKKKTKRKKKKKKDPFPKAVYEVLYRLNQRDVPTGHHKALQDNLIKSLALRNVVEEEEEDDDDKLTDNIAKKKENDDEIDDTIVIDHNNNDDIFVTPIDIDIHTNSHRLIICPMEDQICNYEKVKLFFKTSINNNNENNENGKNGSTTIFDTIPNCGHVFDENGKILYEHLAAMPKIKNFLLE